MSSLICTLKSKKTKNLLKTFKNLKNLKPKNLRTFFLKNLVFPVLPSAHAADQNFLSMMTPFPFRNIYRLINSLWATRAMLWLLLRPRGTGLRPIAPIIAHAQVNPDLILPQSEGRRVRRVWTLDCRQCHIGVVG